MPFSEIKANVCLLPGLLFEGRTSPWYFTWGLSAGRASTKQPCELLCLEPCYFYSLITCRINTKSPFLPFSHFVFMKNRVGVPSEVRQRRCGVRLREPVTRPGPRHEDVTQMVHSAEYVGKSIWAWESAGCTGVQPRPTPPPPHAHDGIKSIFRLSVNTWSFMACCSKLRPVMAR